MHKAAPTNMNSLSRAIINTKVYFSLWTSTLHALCPCLAHLGTSWRSSHAAGENQPWRHSQSLGHGKLPHSPEFPILQRAEVSPALSLQFDPQLCHIHPVPSAVPNTAADALALLASIPHAAILDVPAFQTHILSIIWCIFICDCHDFSPSVWLNGSSVVQISVLHSAALFQVFQASMTAPSHWYHLHHAHKTPDRDNFT